MAIEVGNANNGIPMGSYIPSSGGTTNYEDLTNKPTINSIALEGNKTSTDLSLASSEDVTNLEAQLNNKQEKFTTNNPLSLTQQIIQNAVGGNYTNGTFTAIGSDNTPYFYKFVRFDAWGKIQFSSQNGRNTTTSGRYISFPWSVPVTSDVSVRPSTSYYFNGNYTYGYFNNDGVFVPILALTGMSSSNYGSGTVAMFNIEEKPMSSSTSSNYFVNEDYSGSSDKYYVGRYVSVPKGYYCYTTGFNVGDTFVVSGVQFTLDAKRAELLSKITVAMYASQQMENLNDSEQIEIKPILATDGETIIFNGGSGSATQNSLELNLSATEGNLLTINDDGLYASAPVSDSYTKAEVDTKLNAKQNTLTAHFPLSIAEYAYSNLEGWNYTPDGTGIYNATMRYALRPGSVGSSSDSILIPYGANSIQCKVVIPYQLGQVIKIPSINYASGGSNYQGVNVALCKMLSDGTLIPIMNPRSATTSNNINQIDAPTSESTSSVAFQAGGSGTGSAISSPNWQGTEPNVFYTQLWGQDSDTVYILATNGLNAGNNYAYTGADAARLREVNCAVITPYYYDGGTYEQHYGDNADNALPVADFGLYNASQPLLLYDGPSSFTENLFSIESSSLTTNLELKISSEENNTLELKEDGLYASGGTTDYTSLTAKPQINSVELNGNVSLASLNVYDKDEVDGQLLLKENKITAVSPINLSYYAKSNLEGFTYTTEGDGVYATAGVGYYAGTSANPAWIGIGVGTDTFEGATGFNPKGYIDIPYSIGQTLLTPPGVSYSNNRTTPVIFGKILPSGDFIPLCYLTTGTYSGGKAVITTSDTPSTSSTGLYYTSNQLAGVKLTVGNRTNRPGQHGLIRISKVSDSTYYVDQDARYIGGSTSDLYTARYTVTEPEQIARLEEITTARIYPNAFSESSYNYGINADSPFYVNTIGLYNDLPLNNNIDFNTLTNLFEIGAETAHNYLELNLSAEEGNALEVKSDGLYATGGSYTLPAATTSTLGGVKPDGTTVTVDEDGTIHSTQEGFASLSENNEFTGTNQFKNTVTIGNGFSATALLNMGPASALIYEYAAGNKSLSLGTRTGEQVTILSDGVPVIWRSETRTNQSEYEDNPYTKYNNIDSGNLASHMGGLKIYSADGTTPGCTQTQYDALETKDANTLYIITGA